MEPGGGLVVGIIFRFLAGFCRCSIFSEGERGAGFDEKGEGAPIYVKATTFERV